MNIWELPYDVIWDLFGRIPTKDVLQFGAAGPRFREIVNAYKPEMKKRLKLSYKTLFGIWDLRDCVQDPDHFAYPAISLEGIDAETHSLMQQYGDQFGDSVERLKVESFHIQQTQMEKAFFEKLVNMKDLCIEDLKHCGSFYNVFTGKAIEACTLPANVFDEIEKLKFERASDPFPVHFLLQSCPKIKHLSYGIVGICEEPGWKLERDKRILNDLSAYLDSRQPGPLIIDFADFDYNEAPVAALKKFIRTVSVHNVTIFGFPGSTLELIASGLYTQFNANEVISFLKCVHGVNGLESGLCLRRLPNLQEIIAIHITENSLAQFQDCFPATQIENWPNLKKLEVWIDVEPRSFWPETNSGRIIRDIVNFLLNGSSNVSDLKVCIARSRILSYLMPNLWTQHFNNLERLDLDVGFYFIEVMNLFRALGRNTRIKNLKLTLWDDVNAYMFIGADREHPAFLAMTGLKHFQVIIKTSNFGPNVPISPADIELADSLFTVVFSQSSLTCLSLESVSNWNFPVTTSALNSLLTGRIGNILRYLDFSHPHIAENGKADFDAALRRIREKMSLNRMMQISSINQHGECANCFYL